MAKFNDEDAEKGFQIPIEDATEEQAAEEAVTEEAEQQDEQAPEEEAEAESAEGSDEEDLIAEAEAIVDEAAEAEADALSEDTALQAALLRNVSLPAAVAFMIFVLLYFPCIATFVAIKNETGKWSWATAICVYTIAVAWIAAFAGFHITALLL